MVTKMPLHSSIQLSLCIYQSVGTVVSKDDLTAVKIQAQEQEMWWSRVLNSNTRKRRQGVCAWF